MNGTIKTYQDTFLEPDKYPGEKIKIDPSGFELPEKHPVTLAIKYNKEYKLTPKYYGDEFPLNKSLFNEQTGEPVKSFWGKLTLIHDIVGHALGPLIQNDLKKETPSSSRKELSQFITPPPNRIGEQKAQVNSSYYLSMILEGKEPTYEEVYENVKRSLERLKSYQLTPPKISKKTIEVWIEQARQGYHILKKNNHLPENLIRKFFNKL